MFKAIGVINLSIGDIIVSSNNEQTQENFENNIGCYIKVNDKVFDIILFSKKNPTVSNLILKKTENLQILFKNVKKNNVEIGKIAVDFSIFSQEKPKESVSKWFNISNSFSESIPDLKAFLLIEANWYNSLNEIKYPQNYNNKELKSKENEEILLNKLRSVEETLVKFKKNCLDFEEEKGKSSNFSSISQRVKTLKQEFYDLLQEQEKIKEKKPEFSQSFQEKKLNISILFSELDDLQEKKPQNKGKSHINFDKLMTKMQKEITLLSKVVENKDFYCENTTKNEQIAKSLQNQISHYKETNQNLENKVKELTLQLETRENLGKSSKDSAKNLDFYDYDLETLLNIVNFIKNNPGINTIIFQEFKERLKLPISKQIFAKLEQINAKISQKNQEFSPAKAETTGKSKKRLHSAPNNKKKPSESPCDSSKLLLETPNTSKEIDKALGKFQEDYDKSLEIQKTSEEGHYILNKKKVILQLVNGKLAVKLGAGFLQLKDFLQLQRLKKQ